MTVHQLEVWVSYFPWIGSSVHDGTSAGSLGVLLSLEGGSVRDGTSAGSLGVFLSLDRGLCP